MIIWVSPSMCRPPHRVTRPDQVDSLIQDFVDFGWWGESLVGYFTWDEPTKEYALQLLSGSHRWAAANTLGMRIPVYMEAEDVVEEAWGDLVKWQEIMNKGRENEVSVRMT